MALSCGCEFTAGGAISPEQAKEHFKHTYEAIFCFEILVRRGAEDAEKRNRLSLARVELLTAIEELFPEVKEE